MSRDELVSLKRHIWPADAARAVRIYAVLDCARNSSIYDLISRSYREKSCLFAGNLHPEIERAAPFLLELHATDSVTDEILHRGWNDAWGVLVQSESSFHTLRRHLRTFLRVRTDSGKVLLFRYYDPRVLNIYLPTCLPEELALLFGDKISAAFTCSADTLNVWRYHVQNGTLDRQVSHL